MQTDPNLVPCPAERIAYTLSGHMLLPDNKMQSSVLAFFIHSINACSERTLNFGAHERKHLIRNLACTVKQLGLPDSRIPPWRTFIQTRGRGREATWCQSEANLLTKPVTLV